MTFLFGGILLAGMGYLLLMVMGVLNDTPDVDGVFEDNALGTLFGVSDAEGLGCSVIAAFMAGFGAVGLTGTLAGWNILVIFAGALAFGVILGRLVTAMLRFVYNQQSTSVYSASELIGMSARVTIDSPAGKTGEAIVEHGEVLKYSIQEINGAELKRGDTVEILEASGHILKVKKKRG